MLSMFVQMTRWRAPSWWWSAKVFVMISHAGVFLAPKRFFFLLTNKTFSKNLKLSKDRTFLNARKIPDHMLYVKWVCWSLGHTENILFACLLSKNVQDFRTTKWCFIYEKCREWNNCKKSILNRHLSLHFTISQSILNLCLFNNRHQ